MIYEYTVIVLIVFQGELLFLEFNLMRSLNQFLSVQYSYNKQEYFMLGKKILTFSYLTLEVRKSPLTHPHETLMITIQNSYLQ